MDVWMFDVGMNNYLQEVKLPIENGKRLRINLSTTLCPKRLFRDRTLLWIKTKMKTSFLTSTKPTDNNENIMLVIVNVKFNIN